MGFKLPPGITVRDYLDSLPDESLVPVYFVKQALEAAGEIAEGSPGQVAKRLGRSSRYWREAAKAGSIRGAYEDEGRWRLPLAACREHLGRKAVRARGFYGPRKKAPGAPAARTGATSLPKGIQLLGRPASLERAEDAHSRPGERKAGGR